MIRMPPATTFCLFHLIFMNVSYRFTPPSSNTYEYLTTLYPKETLHLSKACTVKHFLSFTMKDVDY